MLATYSQECKQLRRRRCYRHGKDFGPCSCSLGRLPRLVEPVLLGLLAAGEARYGYQLLEKANQQLLTDSEIDAAAVYRTLRTLEQNGCVISQWQPGSGGPHRRVYEITPLGQQHLQDWLTVLGRHAETLKAFVKARNKD